MATLYWHNKNGTNNANDRTNYTTNIGGTTVATVGVMDSDTLLFNGSGTGHNDNWTLSTNLTVGSADFTGYTGIATNTYIFKVILAGIKLATGMTISDPGGEWNMGVAGTFTSNGKTIYEFDVSLATGTVTLADNLVCTLLHNSSAGGKTISGAGTITATTFLDDTVGFKNININNNIVLTGHTTFNLI